MIITWVDNCLPSLSPPNLGLGLAINQCCFQAEIIREYAIYPTLLSPTKGKSRFGSMKIMLAYNCTIYIINS